MIINLQRGGRQSDRGINLIHVGSTRVALARRRIDRYESS